MNELFIRFSSLFRIGLILIVIVLAYIFSTLSFIIDPKGDMSHSVLRLAGKAIVFFCGVKLHIQGYENIHDDKIQVFASNHCSHLDVPVIFSALTLRTGWLAKKELFILPFLGWLMSANKYIPIDRGDGRKAVESLKAAVEKIRSGTRIVIFPEGTRSKDGELQPFKKLLFRLCLRTGVPVVPIYIIGTMEVLRAGSFTIRPGHVYVKIGGEIQTSAYAANRSGELMNDFRERMLVVQKEAREMKAFYEDKTACEAQELN